MRRRPRPCRAGLALGALVVTGALVGCRGTGQVDVGYGMQTGSSSVTSAPVPGSTSEPEEPMTERPHGPGDVVTEADLATSVHLAPGEEVTLRLAPPLQEVTPTVADPAVVELVPVDHLVDPGYAEYQLLAHEAGSTTVTVGRTDDHPEDLVLEVVVDGG